MTIGQSDAEKYRDIVEFAGSDDIVLLMGIGKIVLTGIAEIEKMGRFSQKSMLAYSTYFPVKDGEHWRLQVQPCDAEGNVQ